MFGVILAGGLGSRLWPLSRELYPKQLLTLNTDKSLLQTTFERLNKFIPAKKIISVTNSKHHSNIKMQLAKLSEETVILAEPISKNTAPAIALSVKYIVENFEDDDVILVVPSDLQINDSEKFIQTMQSAEHFTKEEKVVNFVEKPDKQTAEKYIQDGNYFWNSGIFMFKASTIIEEIKKYCPEIDTVIRKIDFSEKSISFTEFDKMPNISIDYAVMEKSSNIVMVELQSDWKDLGSWKSIYEISPKDENNNVFVGHVLDKGSKNSLVYSSSKLVATIGLEDTVIVETEDAILACKKDKTEEVKQVYETLKQQHDGTQKVHKTVYRPWGFYTVIAEGKGFQTKIIHVNPGQKLSVQSHNYRSEHWVVLSGMAKVVLEGKDRILSPGHSIDIAVKAIHSLQNPYEEDLEIIEIQKGDILSEDDIIRYEDIYGRV